MQWWAFFAEQVINIFLERNYKMKGYLVKYIVKLLNTSLFCFVSSGGDIFLF